VRLPYDIPAEFAAHALLSPDWAAYLRRLPRLADELTDEWRLAYDGAPTSGHAGLVLPVLTDDGRAGVL